MASRKARWVLGIVVFLLVMGGLTAFRMQKRAAVEATKAEKLKESAAVELVAVEVMQVTTGEVAETVEVSGTIQPAAQIGVVSKIPGRVQKVRVDVGQAVRAGDVLVELERSELAAQVRQAEAAVAAARAGSRQALSAAETQLAVASGQYESSQAMLRQAQTNLKSATDNLERMRDLYGKHAVTKQQLELAETQADVARAQVESAQAAVESARSGLEGARRHLSVVKAPLEVGGQQIQSGEAAVIQAEAALELARAQLANAIVVAPVGGVIASRTINPGELASPGVPLLGIVEVDELYVEVNLTESLVGRVRNGMTVAVKVDAFPERSFTGRISNLAPAADPRTRTFPARVRLANPGGELKPGMFATAALSTARRSGVVVVPTSALVDRNGQSVVFVVEDGKAVEREVTVGLRNREVVEIKSGLKPGEQLVIRGHLQLADGVAVRLNSEEGR